MSNVRHCLSLVAAMTVVMIVPAHAYLDPGTGSILLQAIIGGIAATLFVARGYIHRAKEWLGLGPKAAEHDLRAGKE